MKRIVAVIGLALMIGVLSAASALASAVSPGVWAPNNGQVGGGQSGNHAPERTLITCIPGNQGTGTAEGHSPAIALCILD